MASPTGIIPEQLIRQNAKQEVIRWLKQQPAPGHFKRSLLLGWAMTVGVKIRGAEYREVEASGTDQ